MKRLLIAACLLLVGSLAQAQTATAPAKAASLQAAIDAAPGKIVYLPPGDYLISTKLVISKPGSGLSGFGRIIQTNPDEPIIEVGKADNVQLRNITLTRAEGKMEAKASAISAHDSRNLLIDGVQVIDNHAQEGSIYIIECPGARIMNCLVQNYARIGIDDRMRGYGYAFNAIDGTGIMVKYSAGCLIQGNRVIELKLLPTQAVKDQYQLGKFVKKADVKSPLISQEAWDSNYTNVWHQGAAIQVTSPYDTDYIQILGNNIENAAQGIDIHADHVIVSQNIVNNSFIGMKAMHGARNVLIIGNQFSKNDLWAIGLMPGTSSRAAGVPFNEQMKPEQAKANNDGGSIIANNIISDFGYGNAHWMWPGNEGCPIRFDAGPLPVNPALSDVLIEGNIIYDPGRDQIMVGGKPQIEPPRYKYAVLVEVGSAQQKPPVGLHFSNNLFHPGRQGVSNAELKP